MAEHGPHLTRYLEGLPAGWASHPGARVRAATLNTGVDLLGLRPEPEMPEPLRALLAESPPGRHHIPEVLNQALYAWIRDARFEDDESFYAFTDKVFQRFYASPVYRVAFLMARPELLAGTSARLWGWVRTGSRLEVQIRQDRELVLRLQYPLGLFAALHAEMLRRGLGIAYRATRGVEGLEIETVEHTLDELRYRLRWERH